MLASVTIITLLMSAVFAFMFQVQKRFQGNVVVSESNQSARAALEILTQEIGQAGYNPNYSPHKTSSAPVTAGYSALCVTLDNTTGINPGDWLSVDTGVNNEIVQVTGNTANGACTTANQIKVVLQMDHTTTPFPVLSYKFPYPTGILTGTVNGQSTSSDTTLMFYGDISDNGQINSIVYSLDPTTNPATTVTVGGATYALYNLYRSITPVTFPTALSLGTNNQASPLVQNVMYDLANQRGPTGQPLFGYPSTMLVGFVPSQITVVGTIVVTISVAVNPRALESGIIEWYTLATQIRPLNLAAAVGVNQAGGGKFMAKAPLSLPMTNPTGYY
jgi:hypothetical protein